MQKDFILITLADDDEDDRMFFTEAFDELKINTVVNTVNDGVALMEFLNAPESILPNIIFLDLNMPVMGGWEFLDHFTSSAYSDFNTAKVIVLSSTIDPHDLAKAKKYPIIIDFLSKPITKPMLEYLKKKIEL